MLGRPDRRRRPVTIESWTWCRAPGGRRAPPTRALAFPMIKTRERKQARADRQTNARRSSAGSVTRVVSEELAVTPVAAVCVDVNETLAPDDQQKCRLARPVHAMHRHDLG